MVKILVDDYVSDVDHDKSNFIKSVIVASSSSSFSSSSSSSCSSSYSYFSSSSFKHLLVLLLLLHPYKSRLCVQRGDGPFSRQWSVKNVVRKTRARGTGSRRWDPVPSLSNGWPFPATIKRLHTVVYIQYDALNNRPLSTTDPEHRLSWLLRNEMSSQD